jgi:hypothetical protein
MTAWALTGDITEDICKVPMPRAGTVTEFRVGAVDGNFSGTTTIHLKKNGSNSAMVVTTNNGVQFISDTTHTFAVAKDDFLAVSFSSGGLTNAGLWAEVYVS